MVDLGLKDFQAAGLLGNLGFESGGFLHLQEINPLVSGSAGGLGVAQWTGPRRRSFESWCAANHLSTSSDEGNYGFLLHELQGPYAYTVAALKKTISIEGAVFSAGQTYERPYGTTATHLPGYDGRLAYAQRALSGAPAVSPPAIHPVLRWGSTGDDVAELQRRLNTLGYDCGAVDADFGERTERALAAFQSDRHITVDGVCGGSTWNNLAQAERERTLP